VPPPLEPFLDAAAFIQRFGPLKETEKLWVAPLLEVVSNWIREPSRKPDLPADDGAGEVVTFEIVREAVWFARREGLSTFSFTTGHRTKSGTVAPGIDDFVTDRHKQMLGLSTSRSADPAYHFAEYDY
jgi:hypothetical protein